MSNAWRRDHFTNVRGTSQPTGRPLSHMVRMSGTTARARPVMAHGHKVRLERQFKYSIVVIAATHTRAWPCQMTSPPKIAIGHPPAFGAQKGDSVPKQEDGDLNYATSP